MIHLAARIGLMNVLALFSSQCANTNTCKGGSGLGSVPTNVESGLKPRPGKALMCHATSCPVAMEHGTFPLLVNWSGTVNFVVS